MKFAPFLCAAALFPLAACGDSIGSDKSEKSAEAAPTKAEWTGDGMTSRDGEAAKDDVPRPEMRLQVVLDRLGFSPGVVDGKMGLSTTNALKGFQEAKGLTMTGEWDTATKAALAQWDKIPATRVVKIPADYAALIFAPLPEKPADQSKLAAMGYETMLEKLAERFHTTPEVLKALNPQIDAAATTSAEDIAAAPPIAPGAELRVPNAGADTIVAANVDNQAWLATLGSLGVGSEQPKAERVEVSKKAGTMKVFDAGGKLIALFTVTTGSAHDPLPIGSWKVRGVGRNPDYAFDPALLRNVPASEGKHRLPPGPNNPVGVVWIDLNKEHYGLHGTPEPQNIGRSESNGCVRLTNWDAARLAQMVAPGTKVDFVA
ncbi:MAG: murein L,D-transpeptidase [Sphingopyxis sp.]|nr:murein L,D-transpeptidase [Sphingopyxis sp.]